MTNIVTNADGSITITTAVTTTYGVTIPGLAVFSVIAIAVVAWLIWGGKSDRDSN